MGHRHHSRNLNREMARDREEKTMENTAPKSFVFILMPFSSDFDDVYHLGIKAACKDAGVYCERVDEQIYDDSIIQRIYNQIAKADLIVADIPGEIPTFFTKSDTRMLLIKEPFW